MSPARSAGLRTFTSSIYAPAEAVSPANLALTPIVGWAITPLRISLDDACDFVDRYGKSKPPGDGGLAAVLMPITSAFMLMRTAVGRRRAAGGSGWLWVRRSRAGPNRPSPTAIRTRRQR
jgi:hypothetical protein